MAERLRPLFRAKNVSLAVEAPLPALAAVDAVRMERAISNLILNALKYGEGSPVTVAVVESEDAVTVTVKDQGPGISPADRGRIFRRFERANSSPDITGLGLGLYITREIVEAHGGQLTVESQPFVNTAFRIRLLRDGRT